MNRIQLRDEVQKAIRSEWPTFAANHPHLAKALDETLLIEEAIETLSDDPEYQDAMRTAAAFGTGAEAISGVVRKLVNLWLRRLVG